jgi:hypothetical protein
MKNVLLVAWALGFGLFPGIAGFPFNLLTLFVPLLLGLIYCVLHRHDWPPRLVPWLLACVAIRQGGGAQVAELKRWRQWSSG